MMGGGASHVVFLDNTERDGEWLGERDVLKVERGFRVAVVVALDVLALPDRGRARKDDEGETVREFEFDRERRDAGRVRDEGNRRPSPFRRRMREHRLQALGERRREIRVELLSLCKDKTWASVSRFDVNSDTAEE